ncbi:MAG: DUF4168 domain-containing protein [Gemmatimonadetes bacterium]|nr:DUF4168 domain-containing protein [Gemmatimonadota bacterium]
MRGLLLLCLTVVSPGLAPSPADAQASAVVTAQPDSMTAFAKAWVAVAEIRDKAHAEMANPRTKKLEDQARLREQLRKDIAAALKAHGLTQQAFDRLTTLVSSDDNQRKAFEAMVADLTSKKPAPTVP